MNMTYKLSPFNKWASIPETMAQTSLWDAHFVIERINPTLATSKHSIFQLVSVTVQTHSNLTLSETPKTDFLALRPILYRIVLTL